MLAHIPNKFEVTLLGKDIRPSHSAKDLGIVLDSHLTFNEHVTDLVSKCTSSLCQINRIKHLFDQPMLMNILNSLVFSKLFYCSSVWAGTTQKNILKLQSVQNFAARIVTGSKKFDDITLVLRRLKWLPVAKQLVLRDAVMTFKCLNNMAPQYLSSVFCKRSSVHMYDTRNCQKLQIPSYRTATAHRTHSNIGQYLFGILYQIHLNNQNQYAILNLYLKHVS